MTVKSQKIGLLTATSLVVGNMIGVGMRTPSTFMPRRIPAQDMPRLKLRKEMR